jgi:hypothetical protein
MLRNTSRIALQHALAEESDPAKKHAILEQAAFSGVEEFESLISMLSIPGELDFNKFLQMFAEVFVDSHRSKANFSYGMDQLDYFKRVAAILQEAGAKISQIPRAVIPPEVEDELRELFPGYDSDMKPPDHNEPPNPE